MGDLEEKIVVFKAYDTVMQANLAKTKLDAYGIPCFLTDENFTGWYPIRNSVFPGARLHIFEKDVEEVKSILEHEIDIGFIKCPNCGSDDHDPYLSNWGRFSYLVAGIFGMLFPNRPHVEYQCKNCHQIFHPDLMSKS